MPISQGNNRTRLGLTGRALWTKKARAAFIQSRVPWPRYSARDIRWMLRMTPKQTWNELNKIAGAYCGSTGKPFIKTEAISGAELKRMQKSLLALMDKLNYRRTMEHYGEMPITAGEIRRTGEALRIQQADLPSYFRSSPFVVFEDSSRTDGPGEEIPI